MKTIRFLIILIALASSTSLVSGCAGRKTTTESTTEVRTEPASINDTSYDDRTAVELTKTTQVTKESGHRGFFGILGDIIALPFRAVASIL